MLALSSAFSIESYLDGYLFWGMRHSKLRTLDFPGRKGKNTATIARIGSIVATVECVCIEGNVSNGLELFNRSNFSFFFFFFFVNIVNIFTIIINSIAQEKQRKRKRTK